MKAKESIYTIISIAATIIIAAFYIYLKVTDNKALLNSADIGNESTCDINRNDYLMEEVYGGTPAPLSIDLGEPSFMTREAIEKGYGETNFAGHYSVVTWGCGGDCQESAIVDAKSGKVTHFKTISKYGISICQNNRILTVNPPENLAGLDNTPRGLKTSYFEMTDDGTLLLLCEENAGKK